MTTSKLPEITLTCRNGHPFRSRARANSTVRCPDCGAPKHVPADRPATERAARQSAAVVLAVKPEPSADLVARWAAEPEWDGQLHPAPARDGDVCPECGGPLLWEPGRTLTVCPACLKLALPAAIAAHYDRQAKRSSEIAVRSAPGEPTLADRVQLRAVKDLERKNLEEWLEGVADEDSYDRPEWQAQARQFASLIRAYLPEIDRAADSGELAAVKAEIARVLSGDLCKRLVGAYTEAQDRAERQWEARQRQAEFERLAAAEAKQAERERKEAERAAREAEREAERAERERRKQLATVKPPAYPNGWVMLGKSLLEAQQRRTDALTQHGACGFSHWTGDSPASRFYGVPDRDWQGNMTGYRLPDTPQIRACAKHWQAAEAHLKAQGCTDIAYWEV